jgi:hypothetical protein
MVLWMKITLQQQVSLYVKWLHYIVLHYIVSEFNDCNPQGSMKK